MFDNWVIGVMLRMSSNATQVLGGVEAATRRVEAAKKRMQISADLAAGRITNQQAMMQRGILNVQNAEAALDEARERFSIRQGERLKAQQEQQRRTALMVQAGIAAAGVGLIASGIHQAGELERAMANISVKTGVTGPGLDAMRAMVQKVSGSTAQDSVTIAQELAKAATGINDPKKLMKAFPQIAKFADVAFLQNGSDPVESVSIGTSFAHLFKAYSGAPLSHMLDNLNKLMNMQPDGMRDALTQGRQFIPFASQMGVKQDDIFAYMAYMGQTGYLKGRGGTGFQNVLLNSVNAAAPTGTLSKAKVKAREDLELKSFKFFDNNHNFRFQELVDKLSQDRDRLKSKTGNDAQFIKDITDLFGKEGGRFIGNIASKQAQEQISTIRKTYARLPGVEATWKTFSETFLFAWNQLMTNTKNIMISVFFPALSRISPIMLHLANVLGTMTDWFNSHPDAGLGVAYTAFTVTALAAASAARNIWLLAGAFNPFKAAASMLLNPVKALWTAFWVLPGPLKLAVAAVALVWGAFEVFRNGPNIAAKINVWWSENRGHILYMVGFVFGQIANALQTAINGLWSSALSAISNMPLLPKEFSDQLQAWNKALQPHGADKPGPDYFGAGYQDARDHSRYGLAIDAQAQYDHKNQGPRVHAPVSQDTHFNFTGNIIVQGGVGPSAGKNLIDQVKSITSQRSPSVPGPTLHRLQFGY